MNYLTVGVLGHVDHGKTALVRALTGVETDRLKEERERGISIVLGFADLTLPEGRVAFVDAPGHERFVRTMISGATGIGAAIMVVDANEGVRQQTREHFEIAKLLGIPSGIAVVSKCDAADSVRIQQTLNEIRQLVAGSFLESAPILQTSALDGSGLDELRQALGSLVAAARAHEDEGSAYLPIDRVFSMSGFGTVVTGTLRRGALREGDEVQFYPGGRLARVRQIESHGEHVAQGIPGRRTAVNLRGVEKSDLQRGFVLASPGSIRPATLLDASIALLPGAARPLRGRDSVRLLFGTAEVLVRPRFLDRDELAPGGSCVAQLEARDAVPFLVRERFVLRAESPVTTIGGGTFLGATNRRRPRTPESISALDALATHNVADVLALRVAEAEPDAVELPAFARTHRFQLDDARSAAAALRLAALEDGRVARPELAEKLSAPRPETTTLIPEDAGLADEIEASFRDAGLEPPSITDAVGPDRVRNRVYRRLVDAGDLVPVYSPTQPKTLSNTIVFHRDTVELAKQRLIAALSARQPFETKDAKAALGVSRKYLIPLLDYLDAQRFTRRRGDSREFVVDPAREES